MVDQQRDGHAAIKSFQTVNRPRFVSSSLCVLTTFVVQDRLIAAALLRNWCNRLPFFIGKLFVNVPIMLFGGKTLKDKSNMRY